MSRGEQSTADETSSGADGPRERPRVDDLLDELELLEQQVRAPEAKAQLAETMRLARRLDIDTRGTFGNVVTGGFDRTDAAEALVGSVVFGIPMLVESGTLEVGSFVAGNVAYLVGTLAFTVVLVHGLIYVADFQEVEVVNPVLGLVPRRMVGVLSISAATATALMTVWGRVDWSTPWVAACQVSVCFVAMAIGAALGDILPGS
ncbi:Putative integral membrane protein [Halogranum gelatinilyticum]|uniref:Putative integral membrane protein n=1 Tax=Halogranum gelatinilyticum TaxID=660521 RepID=A0A1G9WG75_9EURY|nr:DUF2391 family protein [Halogranum gelatinilyticum]SDM83528.1 Putative integral membrane protein [Halogranum gelatinilyticum]